MAACRSLKQHFQDMNFALTDAKPVTIKIIPNVHGMFVGETGNT